jgi:hypothetical protein
MTRDEAFAELKIDAPFQQGSLYGYHSGPSVWECRPTTKWRLGIEAEKEDSKGQHVCMLYQGYGDSYLPHSWRAERDGSLYNYGFELVSPIYDLFGADLLNHIYDPVLGFLLNSDTSVRCGGHMTISKRDHSGLQVFQLIEPFVPLLYALFPKRAKVRGYAAFVDQDMLKDSKYCAFHIMSDKVELRLFSGIKSPKQLSWRINLLRIMTLICNEFTIHERELSADKIYSMLLDQTSDLHRHLAKVYTKKLGEKIMLTHAYTKAYKKEGVFTFTEYSKIKTKVPKGVFDGRVPVLPAKSVSNSNKQQLSLDVCDYIEESPREA